MVAEEEVRPLRLTLEERTVVPVTAPALEERVELPAERAVEELPPSELLSLERVTTLLPEERVAELLPERAVPLLELLLPLSCRAEEVPPLERVVLPMERAEEELPEERVELLPELTEEELPLERVAELPELLLRLSCWAEEELLLPVERVVCWLPEDRTAEELLEERVELLLELTEEELPLERVPLPVERVVCCPPEEREDPLPEERDWAPISGAMSMARTSIMEVVKVKNRLIASQFLRLSV